MVGLLLLNWKIFLKMNDQLNRYYIKIRTILQIDPKTIHEELVAGLGLSAPSYIIITR